MPESAFYCVADSRYFLGAVGLFNSLRLTGHDQPVHLLDCGLTDDQRELISPQVEIVRDESGAPPWLLKTIAPLDQPADVMVLIDADMIVTRSLEPLIAQAREGKLVAVENDTDRFCPEWAELLGLEGLRRGPYLSSGLVACDAALGTRILELMHQLQDRVDFDQTFWRQNVEGYAFLYGDQDVLNAIVHSDHVDADRLVALPHQLAPTPPFGRLKIVDRRTLACRHADGSAPYVLHNFYRKPWLVPMRSNAYSRLLTRVLTGDDVAVRVPPEWLPVWLRPGAGAAAARLAVDVFVGGPAYVHRRVVGKPRGRRGWADARWTPGRRQRA